MKRLIIILLVIGAIAGGIYYYFEIYSNGKDSNGKKEEVLEPEKGEVAIRYKKYGIEQTLKYSLVNVTEKDLTVYLYRNEVKCDASDKFDNANPELFLKFKFLKDTTAATTVSFFKREQDKNPLEISGKPEVKNEITIVTNDGKVLEGSLNLEWASRQALGEFKADICSSTPQVTE